MIENLHFILLESRTSDWGEGRDSNFDSMMVVNKLHLRMIRMKLDMIDSWSDFGTCDQVRQLHDSAV